MPELLPCTLITWDEMYGLCRQLAWQLRAADFRIDTLIAIGRGGYVPGRILSDMLGIHDLTSFKIEHYRSTRKVSEAFVKYPLSADLQGKNILLLDDVCDSGDTFAVGGDHVRNRGPVENLRTAVLHYKTVSAYKPDFFVETVSDWRWIIYPWAVNEDLSSLLREMPFKNVDLGQLRRLFKERHDLDVTDSQLQDAVSLLQDKKHT
ncbi:phosphoribosyltransferase [Methylomarinum vadi]|uniref:phosphoribosyltransferase n=1 Tax=Methylomarinum vadi TaxID=438855 RepID=UPI0004DF5E5A|nr:phosphoribosyltransferase [Methylomarinum vadi]